ncbi:MAG: hypothetical protein IKK29_02350 [Christensenellaceae bacterium]|nr:hypothetical protein [Christensenellaceae bacterium]
MDKKRKPSDGYTPEGHGLRKIRGGHMKIHYLNAAGEEKMIDGVVHLQNVDNETFIATIEGGKELTLRVSRIEGVADMDMLEKKEIKVSPEMLHHFSRNMRATPADFGIIRITVGAWRSIADLLEAAAEKLEANDERP